MKVEIKNGKAVEVNPLGVEPNYFDFDKYPPVFELDDRRDAEENSRRDAMIREDWESAEAARKVYYIENALTDGWVPTYNDPDNAGCHPMAEPRFEEGSIHEAEIINETTVKIL